MGFCIKCGKEVPEDAYFCLSCGARTLKGREAGVSAPLDEMRDALSTMGRELEKAFQTAAKEIRGTFQKECFFETLTDRRYSFRVVALRIENPRCTFLIYRTGKIVCVGAKTIKSAKQSDEYLTNRLRKAGISAKSARRSL
jgi:hypothetical protein